MRRSSRRTHRRVRLVSSGDKATRALLTSSRKFEVSVSVSVKIPDNVLAAVADSYVTGARIPTGLLPQDGFWPYIRRLLLAILKSIPIFLWCGFLLFLVSVVWLAVLAARPCCRTSFHFFPPSHHSHTAPPSAVLLADLLGPVHKFHWRI